MSITEFLLARIAEDESAVNDRTRHFAPEGHELVEQFGDFGDDERWMIEIPAGRVLAECEAKRRIVLSASDSLRAYANEPETSDEVRDEAVLAGANIAEETLRILAAVYADHPDYDQAWRP